MSDDRFRLVVKPDPVHTDLLLILVWDGDVVRIAGTVPREAGDRSALVPAVPPKDEQAERYLEGTGPGEHPVSSELAEAINVLREIRSGLERSAAALRGT